MKKLWVKLLSLVTAVCILTTAAAAISINDGSHELKVPSTTSAVNVSIDINESQPYSGMDFTMSLSGDLEVTDYSLTSGLAGAMKLPLTEKDGIYYFGFASAANSYSGSAEINVLLNITGSGTITLENVRKVTIENNLSSAESIFDDFVITVTKAAPSTDPDPKPSDPVNPGGGSTGGGSTGGGSTSTYVFPFTDCSAHWAKDAVAYVNEKGIMNGVSATTFSPDSTTTRGMIVTMLYRLAGSPSVSSASSFTDVKSGSYYYNATVWAAGNGIVKGTTDTTFAPDTNITREQLATIIYRYSTYAKYNTASTATVNQFADASSIHDWALDSVKWAVGLGLIQGVGDNTLSPAGNATRGQVATIFYRFMENVVK